MVDGKDVLRKTLRRARRDLSPIERLQAATQVGQHFRDAGLAAVEGYVAGYWAIAGELALHAVQSSLGPGQIWCLPIVRDDGYLSFAPWRMGDPLRPNRFGIPEPDLDESSFLPPGEMTLVLLPLLGYDEAGHRLGQGGGYYDRAFAFRQQRAAPPLLVGVGYDFQQVELPPTQPWDVVLDVVLTPSGQRRFDADSGR